MSPQIHCSGVRQSGHWKGWNCGAVPQYQTEDGRYWCKNHLPVNQKATPIKKVGQ